MNFVFFLSKTQELHICILLLYNINKAINKNVYSNIKMLHFRVEVMDQYDIEYGQ